ncbi:21527_t:CDS:2, partial [Cetraspora pellucida]
TIKEKSDLETENFRCKAKNAKLKAENAYLIEDIAQSSVCLESLITLETQRSTRGTSSNLLPIKDLSDKKYSVSVNLSQLKAEPISLEDKEINEFLNSKYKKKVSKEIIQSIKKKKLQEHDLSLPQSCNVKTVTKCHD